MSLGLQLASSGESFASLASRERLVHGCIALQALPALCVHGVRSETVRHPAQQKKGTRPSKEVKTEEGEWSTFPRQVAQFVPSGDAFQERLGPIESRETLTTCTQ